MRRSLVVVYGVLSYLAFLAVFGALAGFVANAGPSRGIDTGPSAPLPVALTTDLCLVGVFGVTHSVMARRWFKERWTRIVPPCIERSTYVLVTTLTFALLIWQWQTMPIIVWSLEHPAARMVLGAISGFGVLLVVGATFLTSHFDLFGLRQVVLYARGIPYFAVPFQERGLYKRVRHPMMLGVLLWLWAAPTMSVGHLAFSGAMSLYIAIGIVLEERGLARELGAPYLAYRARVRALIPFPKPRRRGDGTSL
jgi:protein-S-isoprenylcysteine O-methyltransferase Ste14